MYLLCLVNESNSLPVESVVSGGSYSQDDDPRLFFGQQRTVVILAWAATGDQTGNQVVLGVGGWLSFSLCQKDLSKCRGGREKAGKKAIRYCKVLRIVSF